MKKAIIRVGLALAVLGAAYGGYRYFERLPERQSSIATAKVRRGDVTVRAFTRGELRAVRTETLYAPNLFSTVQVTRLAPLGSLAKEKDLIVEFDDSERRTALEETLLEVEQVDEQIKKAQADLAIRNNQDQVELLRARYSVRRAELEVQRNPLLGEIDQKKNLLNLDEAKRRLKQLESDINSRKAQAEAELAVLRDRRARSMLDVNRERQRIAQSKVLSPITGLVAIKQNRGGFQGSFGQQVPDIREGDTLQPGTPVADVLDLSEMEIVAKVGELDRANLHEGQEVRFQLDALPDKTFHGKIKGMSATASADPFSGDPAKKFDVLFSVDMKELMTILGATPEQIRRVQETAAANAKRALTRGGLSGPPAGGDFQGMAGPMAGIPGMEQPGAMFGGGSGPGGEGMMIRRGEGRGGRGEGGAGRGGPGGDRMAQMLAQLPPEAKKIVDAELKGRKIESLSPEDRRAVFAKLREAGVAIGGRGGRGGPGGQENPRDFNAPIVINGFTEADRENARLPLPPEEDSQLDVLLRPGLLADVEITVESIPDAIHVPNQAIFERNGRSVVFVQNPATQQFEERPVKLAKRSESVSVIAEGLKPDEIIALSDPLAQRDSKKKADEGKKSGAPALPTAAPKGN